jgi:hypothetical protein
MPILLDERQHLLGRAESMSLISKVLALIVLLAMGAFFPGEEEFAFKQPRRDQPVCFLGSVNAVYNAARLEPGKESCGRHCHEASSTANYPTRGSFGATRT